MGFKIGDVVEWCIDGDFDRYGKSDDPLERDICTIVDIDDEWKFWLISHNVENPDKLWSVSSYIRPYNETVILIEDLEAQVAKLTEQNKLATEALKAAKHGLVQWHVPENRYTALDAVNEVLSTIESREVKK
jgi:hypothetical protein